MSMVMIVRRFWDSFSVSHFKTVAVRALSVWPELAAPSFRLKSSKHKKEIKEIVVQFCAQTWNNLLNNTNRKSSQLLMQTRRYFLSSKSKTIKRFTISLLIYPSLKFAGKARPNEMDTLDGLLIITLSYRWSWLLLTFLP